MVNGHPSWININYGIWFTDILDEWVVGPIAKRGEASRWIESNGQGGSICPFDISSTNWNLFYSNQWNTGSGAGVTCSQAKSKSNILNSTEYNLQSEAKLRIPFRNCIGKLNLFQSLHMYD